MTRPCTTCTHYREDPRDALQSRCARAVVSRWPWLRLCSEQREGACGGGVEWEGLELADCDCGERGVVEVDGQPHCPDCRPTGTCECGAPTVNSEFYCHDCVAEYQMDVARAHCDDLESYDRAMRGEKERR